MDIYYVYKNNKIGVFHNKEVVPPIYDRLYLTSNESIIVYKNYKRGLYNSEGKLIIPPYYNLVFCHHLNQYALLVSEALPECSHKPRTLFSQAHHMPLLIRSYLQV